MGNSVELCALHLGKWLILGGEKERMTDPKGVTDTMITGLDNKNADGRQESQEKKLVWRQDA